MLKSCFFAASLMALIFITGCSSQSTAVTPTKTPLPTSTLMPTPTPTLAPYQVAAGCGATFAAGGAFFRNNANTSTQFGQIGDLIFTQPAFGFLSYPGVALPDNILPGKPFQVVTLPGPQIAANPGLAGGGSAFELTICNSSTTTSHKLQALGVKIATFIPDISANTNVEVGCDSSFNSHTRQVGTGCGGSLGPSEDFYATWPATIAANTQGTVKQVGTDSSAGTTEGTYGNFPIMLKPGQAITVWVGMDYPPSVGTFTFAFGAKVDTAAMAFVVNTSYPAFLDKNAHKWAGLACQLTASMSAQIPSTGIDHDFVCPQTS